MAAREGLQAAASSAVNSRYRVCDDAGESDLKHYGYEVFIAGRAQQGTTAFTPVCAPGNLTRRLIPD
jgi:hypothetical protein